VIGERRNLLAREQVNLGPCAVCGQNVWAYTDEPRHDLPAVHKRTCVPGGEFNPTGERRAF
jgi:hypothetical protein